MYDSTYCCIVDLFDMFSDSDGGLEYSTHYCGI